MGHRHHLRRRCGQESVGLPVVVAHGCRIVWRLAPDTLDVLGIGDGDGLGVLMLGMMLLGVDLFVLLEILGTLEGLVADFADVRLEWCMDCDGFV
jgi:hypothetical protein